MNPRKGPLRRRLEETKNWEGSQKLFRMYPTLVVSRDEATDNSMKNMSTLDTHSSAFSAIFYCVIPKFLSPALKF